MMNKVFENIKTPAYVVDEKKLIKNLEILESVRKRSGARILLAQKAFSMYSMYSLIGKYLDGTTASGLYEAKLGTILGKQNHVFAPAFKDEDMDEIVKLADHIVFNSVAQLNKHKAKCKRENVSIGLRINPEISTQKDHEIYDPCSKSSRLGVRFCDFDESLLKDIEGLHFHTLCEQNFDDLLITFKVFEEKFGKYLHGLKWLNMGGGHHITREDYDVDGLVELVRYIKDKYSLEVILEPGEAIALNAGYLVTEVLDIVKNDMEILILDASAACHMPDVLEMPYRPPLMNSGKLNEKAYNYHLSSVTCLAGDVLGDYSFDCPIKVGDRLVFEDMAIYSMVKNNTFNGIPLPDIDILHENGEIEVVKRFGYEDFKGRLS